MEWVVWSFGIFIALIIVFALFMIRIELYYRRHGEDDALRITISTLAGLIRIKRQFPVLKLDADQLSVETKETNRQPFTLGRSQKKRRMTVEKLLQLQQKVQYWKKRIIDLLQIIKGFLARVRCEQLMWRSTVGTGDAAAAGTLTGVVWGIKTSTLGWATRYLKMKTVPELDVTPDFNHPRLDTHFRCIVKFRLGDAIVAGIRLFFHTKKGALKKRLTQQKRSETA